MCWISLGSPAVTASRPTCHSSLMWNSAPRLKRSERLNCFQRCARKDARRCSPDKTVKMRNIATTLTEGDDAAVDKGLEAGDVVAVDGLDKLQDGTPVQVTVAAGAGAASGSKTGE